MVVEDKTSNYPRQPGYLHPRAFSSPYDNSIPSCCIIFFLGNIFIHFSGGFVPGFITADFSFAFALGLICSGCGVAPNLGSIVTLLVVAALSNSS